MDGVSRREFLIAAGAFGLLTQAGGVFAATGQLDGKKLIELRPLPWDQNALAPVISANTIGYHYGKHHKAYVDNLNKQIAGTEYEDRSLEDIVRGSADKPGATGIFNNAAQVWNHNFSWESLSPQGGGRPPAEIARRLEASFGSLEEFRKAFLAAATGQFGSGWVWLVSDKSTQRIALLKTGNADTPIMVRDSQVVPLAVLDVWEHAYYLDYQNKRLDYATAVFDQLLNWRFVEKNLAA